MSTLFTAESSHYRGFEFEKTRTLEKQGDIGYGIQKKEPVQGVYAKLHEKKPRNVDKAKETLKKLVEEKQAHESLKV
jgi:hypothetical protein